MNNVKAQNTVSTTAGSAGGLIDIQGPSSKYVAPSAQLMSPIRNVQKKRPGFE